MKKFLVGVLLGIFIGQVWAFFQAKNRDRISEIYLKLDAVDEFIDNCFPQKIGDVTYTGKEDKVYKIRRIK